MKNLFKICASIGITCITPLIILNSCENHKGQAKEDEKKVAQEANDYFQKINEYNKEKREESLGGKTVWGPSGISPCFYTIQKGDTLSTIALQYSTTAKELARINNIKDKDKIYEGKQIMIYENCKE